MKELEYLEDLNMSLVLKGFKQGAFNQFEKHLSAVEKRRVLKRFVEMAQSDRKTLISRNNQKFWDEVLNVGLGRKSQIDVFFCPMFSHEHNITTETTVWYTKSL